MKVLYVLLLASIAAIVIAVGATLWRLRWHLRRPSQTSQHAALNELQPDHDPVDKR